MLRKHIKDGATPVDVKESKPVVGPCACPQPGCQASSGSYPYEQGNVVYEEYGGGSGDYVSALPCKCCDGKGRLYEGERAYQTYCTAHGVRDLQTGYPDPIPMSRSVYTDPIVVDRVLARHQRQPEQAKKSEGCFVATAVYGAYDAPEVLVLRRFRDQQLLPRRGGKTLVATYYMVSQPLARFVSRRPMLKRVSRALLDHLVHRLR